MMATLVIDLSSEVWDHGLPPLGAVSEEALLALLPSAAGLPDALCAGEWSQLSAALGLTSDQARSLACMVVLTGSECTGCRATTYARRRGSPVESHRRLGHTLHTRRLPVSAQATACLQLAAVLGGGDDQTAQGEQRVPLATLLLLWVQQAPGQLFTASGPDSDLDLALALP